MDKLTELKKKIEEVQAKSAVASDMKAFIKLVLEVVAKAKEDFSKISTENKQILVDAINYIGKEHEKMMSNVSSETENAKQEMEQAVLGVKKLADEIKKMDFKDGKDGKDGTDGKDGKDGKDGSPDTGEQIVDKINALDTDPENQIDAKHIKNLPKATADYIAGVRYLQYLADVKLTSAANKEMLQFDGTTRTWVNGYALTVSATPPSNPKLYDLWYDISP